MRLQIGLNKNRMIETLGAVVGLLESYRGRDKMIRTASYAACLGSTLTKNQDLSQKLLKVMSELSACRTILRLFDDLSMLAITIKYGLGKQEKDVVNRILSIASNFVSQVFFPIEHIAWASEKGLIEMPAAPWWFASLLTWISSLLINILRCLWKLVRLHYKMAKLISKESSESTNSDVKLIRKSQVLECFTLVENASNLGMAIHWLPGSYLWSGKLNNATVGALGIVSSAIGLFKMTVLK